MHSVWGWDVYKIIKFLATGSYTDQYKHCVGRQPVHGIVLWSLWRIGYDLWRGLALIDDINSKTN
jgi:hypothetical protein